MSALPATFTYAQARHADLSKHTLYRLREGGRVAALSRGLYRQAGAESADTALIAIAAYDTLRPTRDIDLQATRLAGDADTVLALVRDIAAVHQDDGLVYDAGSAIAEVIRDEEEYSGARVRLIGHLSRARIPFHVDVNVGDPIVPPPGQVEVPQCQRRRARSLHRRGRHAPQCHPDVAGRGSRRLRRDRSNK